MYNFIHSLKQILILTLIFVGVWTWLSIFYNLMYLLKLLFWFYMLCFYIIYLNSVGLPLTTTKLPEFCVITLYADYYGPVLKSIYWVDSTLALLHSRLSRFFTHNFTHNYTIPRKLGQVAWLYQIHYTKEIRPSCLILPDISV